MMGQPEDQRVPAVLTGPRLSSTESLMDRIVRVARDSERSVAVRDEFGDLSYGSLLEAASALAGRLGGSVSGRPVLISAARGRSELVGVLGIMMAGGHYVALPPELPDPVMARLVKVLEPSAIVGDSSPNCSRLVVASDGALGEVTPPIESGYVQASLSPVESRIAYVGFTSGTTGDPKGALISRRGVLRLAEPWPRGVGRLGPGVRVLRLAPLAFDASTFEIFAPLLTGATSVVYPPGPVTPRNLHEFMEREGVGVAWLTSGLFQTLASLRPTAFAMLDQVITGGDVVSPSAASKVASVAPSCHVTNAYGPTEATTFATAWDYPGGWSDDRSLPIGAPLPETAVAVVDSDLRIVDEGVTGEIVIAGTGVADGYFGRPDLTEKAFPTTTELGRVYRTGDLGVIAGGQLNILGRADGQIKIRGFRVETEAVANALRGHESIQDAVVFSSPGSAASKKIVAAVLATEIKIAEDDFIRQLDATASELLPSYAVPKLWALVQELPLTPNGKTDFMQLMAAARPTPSPHGRPSSGRSN